MADDVFSIPEPKQPRKAESWTPPPANPTYNLGAADVDVSGVQLARDMEEKGYQPVILVGNAFSGKTSVLLSLLSLLKLEPYLEAGLALDQTLLPKETKYGKYQQEQATALFYKKVQQFINGEPITKTAVELPFFVPASFRPKQKPHITFAFMESNGEWYRPNHASDALYPALRSQIEEFIGHYQGGVIFLYLMPYTQQAVWSATADSALDRQELRDADLAITGTLLAYDKIRMDKSRDMHLLLITKWDAHAPASDLRFALSSPDSDDIESVVQARYPQTMACLNTVGVNRDQIRRNAYCSGLMDSSGPRTIRHDNDLRDVLNQYPKNLWSFLYKHALINTDRPVMSPFPPPAKKPIFQRILSKLFD